MSDEKTEEPTQHKLDEAKRRGQAPKSQDVNAAAGLLTGTICLAAAAPAAADHLRRMFAVAIDQGLLVADNTEAMAKAYDLAIEGLWTVLPFVATAIVTGFIAAFAQVGVNITFEPLTPKFDSLNPANGIKKLVSMKSLMELAKTVLKAIVVGAVVYKISIDLTPMLVGTGTQTPTAIAQIAWTALLQLLGAAIVAFVVFGPLDYALQRWQFMKDNRMSKDEIKREYKENEGDPLIKGQRKQIAQEILNSSPRKRVPQATVVVTNPTHYAVALRYVAGETPLPVVLAKGVDESAAVIRQIAQEAGVPIVGNPPLARALYKLPLDATVPEALFESVAAVLRWVATLERMQLDAQKPR